MNNNLLDAYKEEEEKIRGSTRTNIPLPHNLPGAPPQYAESWGEGFAKEDRELRWNIKPMALANAYQDTQRQMQEKKGLLKLEPPPKITQRTAKQGMPPRGTFGYEGPKQEGTPGVEKFLRNALAKVIEEIALPIGKGATEMYGVKPENMEKHKNAWKWIVKAAITGLAPGVDPYTKEKVAEDIGRGATKARMIDSARAMRAMQGVKKLADTLKIQPSLEEVIPDLVAEQVAQQPKMVNPYVLQSMGIPLLPQMEPAASLPPATGEVVNQEMREQLAPNIASNWIEGALKIKHDEIPKEIKNHGLKAYKRLTENLDAIIPGAGKRFWNPVNLLEDIGYASYRFSGGVSGGILPALAETIVGKKIDPKDLDLDAIRIILGEAAHFMGFLKGPVKGAEKILGYGGKGLRGVRNLGLSRGGAAKEATEEVYGLLRNMRLSPVGNLLAGEMYGAGKLGLAGALSNITDPKQIPRAFRDYAIMGSIFSLGKYASIFKTPTANALLRQVGNRAMLNLVGQYENKLPKWFSMSDEEKAQAVWDELLVSYFSLHGMRGKEALDMAGKRITWKAIEDINRLSEEGMSKKEIDQMIAAVTGKRRDLLKQWKKAGGGKLPKAKSKAEIEREVDKIIEDITPREPERKTVDVSEEMRRVTEPTEKKPEVKEVDRRISELIDEKERIQREPEEALDRPKEEVLMDIDQEIDRLRTEYVAEPGFEERFGRKRTREEALMEADEINKQIELFTGESEPELPSDVYKGSRRYSTYEKDIKKKGGHRKIAQKAMSKLIDLEAGFYDKIRKVKEEGGKEKVTQKDLDEVMDAIGDASEKAQTAEKWSDKKQYESFVMRLAELHRDMRKRGIFDPSTPAIEQAFETGLRDTQLRFEGEYEGVKDIDEMVDKLRKDRNRLIREVTEPEEVTSIRPEVKGEQSRWEREPEEIGQFMEYEKSVKPTIGKGEIERVEPTKIKGIETALTRGDSWEFHRKTINLDTRNNRELLEKTVGETLEAGRTLKVRGPKYEYDMEVSNDGTNLRVSRTDIGQLRGKGYEEPIEIIPYGEKHAELYETYEKERVSGEKKKAPMTRELDRIKKETDELTYLQSQVEEGSVEYSILEKEKFSLAEERRKVNIQMRDVNKKITEAESKYLSEAPEDVANILQNYNKIEGLTDTEIRRLKEFGILEEAPRSERRDIEGEKSFSASDPADYVETLIENISVDYTSLEKERPIEKRYTVYVDGPKGMESFGYAADRHLDTFREMAEKYGLKIHFDEHLIDKSETMFSKSPSEIRQLVKDYARFYGMEKEAPKAPETKKTGKKTVEEIEKEGVKERKEKKEDIPAGLSIKKLTDREAKAAEEERKRKEKGEDPDYSFGDKEIDDKVERNRNVPTADRKTKIGKVFKEISNSLTRVLEAVPNTPEYSKADDFFRNLINTSTVAGQKAEKQVVNITEGIRDNLSKMRLFSNFAIIADAKSFADKVPYADRIFFGKDKQWVYEKYHELKGRVENYPDIKEAIEKREVYWSEVKERFIAEAAKLGISTRFFARHDYFQHIMMNWMARKNMNRFLGWAQSRQYTPLKEIENKMADLSNIYRRSYRRRRGTKMGKTGDPMEEGFLTDWVKSEFDVVSKLEYDISLMKHMNWLNEKENKMSEAVSEFEKKNPDSDTSTAKGRADFRSWLVRHEKYRDYSFFFPETMDSYFNLADVVDRMHEELGVRGNDVHDIDILSKKDLDAKIRIKNVMGEPGKDSRSMTDAELATITGVGAKKAWLIPKPVAEQLRRMGSRKESWLPMASGKALGAWKWWQLMSPWRVTKYNFRNFTGDIDPTIGFNPSAILHSIKSMKDLTNYFRFMETSEGLAPFLERGAYASTLQAVAMGDVVKGHMKKFYDLVNKEGKKRLIAKEDKKTGEIQYELKDVHELGFKKMANWYARNIMTMTNWRELVGRYANFLEYRRQFTKNYNKMKENGETGPPEPNNWGCSRRKFIRAKWDPSDPMKSIDDMAYTMAQDVVGNYQRISLAGQTIRRHLYPFWSFQEANIRRYAKGFSNLFQDTGIAIGEGLKSFSRAKKMTKGQKKHMWGKAASSIAKIPPIVALKLGRITIALGAIEGLAHMWNEGGVGQAVTNIAGIRWDDDALSYVPKSDKERPFIFLGQTKHGDPIYFSRIGAISEGLDFFGISRWEEWGEKLKSHYMDGGEVMSEVGKEIVNHWVQGLHPAKQIFEHIIGHTWYPDVYRPRPIRDGWRQVAKSFAVEPIYRLLFNKKTINKAYRNLRDVTKEEQLTFGHKAKMAVKEFFNLNLPSAFIYTRLKEDVEYQNARTIIGDWIKDKDIYRSNSGVDTKKANALYHYKLAQTYKDYPSELTFYTEYINAMAGRAALHMANKESGAWGVNREKWREGRATILYEMLEMVADNLSRSINHLNPLRSVPSYYPVESTEGEPYSLKNDLTEEEYDMVIRGVNTWLERFTDEFRTKPIRVTRDLRLTDGDIRRKLSVDPDSIMNAWVDDFGMLQEQHDRYGWIPNDNFKMKDIHMQEALFKAYETYLDDVINHRKNQKKRGF